MNFFRNVKKASYTDLVEVMESWSTNLQIEADNFTADVTIFFYDDEAKDAFISQMNEIGIHENEPMPRDISLASLHDVATITYHKAAGNDNGIVIDLMDNKYRTDSIVLYYAA